MLLTDTWIMRPASAASAAPARAPIASLPPATNNLMPMVSEQL